MVEHRPNGKAGSLWSSQQEKRCAINVMRRGCMTHGDEHIVEVVCDIGSKIIVARKQGRVSLKHSMNEETESSVTVMASGVSVVWQSKLTVTCRAV